MNNLKDFLHLDRPFPFQKIFFEVSLGICGIIMLLTGTFVEVLNWKDKEGVQINDMFILCPSF